MSSCVDGPLLASALVSRQKGRVEDHPLPSAIQKSDRLHARVQAFAEGCLTRRSGSPLGTESFEQLALDIARFQHEMSAGFARIVSAHTGKLEQMSDIPPLPADTFRFGRVALHPPDLDVATFRTSGTTSSPGRHPYRTLATKEKLNLLQARDTLFNDRRRSVVVAIAETPTDPPASSLGHLMEELMRHFDARPLSTDPVGARFDSRAPGRWLVGSQGPDVEGLMRAARLGIHRSEPLLILATSFALASVLDALDGQKVRVPSKTRIMITGGFKGMRTHLDEESLRLAAERTFSVSSDDIIGEYGMTELTSQLFEIPGTKRYAAPPWLRVQAVEPQTLKPLAWGEMGLAHFIDLGNVDSCLSVLTQDLVTVTEQGITLHGRAPRSSPRGCSLPYEGLVGSFAGRMRS